jgi:hypothetical protein
MKSVFVFVLAKLLVASSELAKTSVKVEVTTVKILELITLVPNATEAYVLKELTAKHFVRPSTTHPTKVILIPPATITSQIRRRKKGNIT